jgi:hypothetical protein
MGNLLTTGHPRDFITRQYIALSHEPVSQHLLPTPCPLYLFLVLCIPDAMPLVKVSSGLKMHYIVPSSPDPNKPYIDPSRPTVVMLHPRFFDSHFFAPQFRDGRLTKAYNIVAIDHHYHGRTEAPLDSKPYDFDLVSCARPSYERQHLIR